MNKNALDTSESERINEILKVKLNKNYKISHPSDEHFYPYFVTIGASSGLKGKSLIKFFSDEGLDYSSFYFEWKKLNNYYNIFVDDKIFLIKEIIIQAQLIIFLI